MTRYRDRLPQLDGDVFLTDGGIETTLIFHRGLELPAFAAFVLLRDEQGTDELRRYYAPYLELARDQDAGYNPSAQLSPEQAQEYHSTQIGTFADTAADMVTAITMTYAGEAIGLTRAAQAAGLPVAISFTVET